MSAMFYEAQDERLSQRGVCRYRNSANERVALPPLSVTFCTDCNVQASSSNYCLRSRQPCDRGSTPATCTHADSRPARHQRYQPGAPVGHGRLQSRELSLMKWGCQIPSSTRLRELRATIEVVFFILLSSQRPANCPTNQCRSSSPYPAQRYCCPRD